MVQNHTKKEALFNEVKGSLFEYLVAKEIACDNGQELEFQQSLDKNYLHVLGQQDRMIRQFYPEMLPFLNDVSKHTVKKLKAHLDSKIHTPMLTGKFSNSSLAQDLHEADLLVHKDEILLPISLKLNRKNAYVNTKSGGIKSFFSSYFPSINLQIQEKFNQLVDLEFHRMSLELHALHDLEYPGHFGNWTKASLSELPGELDQESRKVLKSYYARIAEEMHRILSECRQNDPEDFLSALPGLMGFGKEEILQVICFHEFPEMINPSIEIHTFFDLKTQLGFTKILNFKTTASVEIDVGYFSLHIRVKPMNKFTTTAIKINCSVKVKSPT